MCRFAGSPVYFYSPNSLSDWGSSGFFKGPMEPFAPMLAGALDHFCLKNQWKINVFGPNIGLGVAEVSRPGWGARRMSGRMSSRMSGRMSGQMSGRMSGVFKKKRNNMDHFFQFFGTNGHPIAAVKLSLRPS